MAGFRVVDATSWTVIRSEPQGRSGKEWLRPPEVPIEATTRTQDYLFKPAVQHEDGTLQGGDWSERIVCELAGALGVPCAEVELANRDGVRGTLSRNVTPDGWSLIDGSVLLPARIDGYVGGARLPGRPGHSLENIHAALYGCCGPPGHDGWDAFEIFSGFLLLDGWVANQDRHDRNWAVLERADVEEPLLLAPSFDHTSSLGFNLTDERRRRVLDGNDGLAAWARRGRAHQFEHDPAGGGKVRSLVELACDGLRLAGPRAENHWRSALRQVPDAHLTGIVAAVPGLSEVTATFIMELLAENRRRLLDDDR